MSDPLRLHFNERPDCLTQIDKDMPFDQTLWRYPDRLPLEQALAEINQVKPNQVLATNGGDE
ncbi:MAG: HAD family hydrolase, partial [Gammaproteobacteria bacterium]